MQLIRRQADGATLRAHLLAGAAATGHADPRLSHPAPRAGTALWATWCALVASRPPSMGGAAGVPLSEICAWQQLNRVALTPWEVDTLLAMDGAALAVLADNQKGPS